MDTIVDIPTRLSYGQVQRTSLEDSRIVEYAALGVGLIPRGWSTAGDMYFIAEKETGFDPRYNSSDALSLLTRGRFSLCTATLQAHPLVVQAVVTTWPERATPVVLTGADIDQVTRDAITLAAAQLHIQRLAQQELFNDPFSRL